MTIENNTTSLQNVITLINELPEFHEPHFQEKTVTPSKSSQTVVADTGYDGLEKVTVEPVSSEYIIPSGNLNMNLNGTYNVTKYSQATVSVSTSGDSDSEDDLVTRAVSTYENDRVESIGSYAFYNHTSLKSVNFPACKTIGYSAFDRCSTLTSANFPACTTIKDDAFAYCYSLASMSFPACKFIGARAFERCSTLTSVNFPICSYIGYIAFAYCYSLTSANFPACTTIGTSAFNRCYNLISLYLTGSSLCTLSSSDVFTSTPIGGYSASAGGYGSIYVPQSLLTSYQAATNWTYFSSRFVAYDGNGNTDSGSSPGESITFTIEGTEYQAVEGMTWEEWINSEYNTDGYYINESYVYNGEKYVWCENDGSGMDIARAEFGNNVISTSNYYLDSSSSVFG